LVDFGFTEEEEVFRETLRELLSEVLAPRAREIDTKCRIPDEVIKALGRTGYSCSRSSPSTEGRGPAGSWEP